MYMERLQSTGCMRSEGQRSRQLHPGTAIPPHGENRDVW